MAGAGNGGDSRGSARVDNNQPKSSSNISGHSGGGGDGCSSGSGSGSGSGYGKGGIVCGNVGNNAAAMAAVMAASTVAEGRADVGGDHLSYYLHNSTKRCDTNCQAYDKTRKCFVAKHFSVLLGKTI
jgi:hypothetical protein